eukprot:CAMPEP_0175467370 /NCGR_PEP_ID=MMETSP0095-20121207/71280_1 /TAXON_ID=311494 /ORGANISM="Alexandrium monilatum, Strain CCMP3105" /LENGTH=144 /DNA_ID=CAMNT_0016768731 /DNA_START=38 /DNA_END=472 /DNA_ORIENTATION=-
MRCSGKALVLPERAAELGQDVASRHGRRNSPVCEESVPASAPAAVVGVNMIETVAPRQGRFHAQVAQHGREGAVHVAERQIPVDQHRPHVSRILNARPHGAQVKAWGSALHVHHGEDGPEGVVKPLLRPAEGRHIAHELGHFHH